MISEGYFRRHQQVLGGDRDVVLLDIAQEYVLEHLRRQGLFEETLVFKGGTALRKFIFGGSARFSVDLDFGLRSDDPADVELTLDFLEGAELHGVRIELANREGPNADLRITTPLGEVVRPARLSTREQKPWLRAVLMQPQPFVFLDKGLAPEFRRAQPPILDVREIAGEKIAACVAPAPRTRPLRPSTPRPSHTTWTCRSGCRRTGCPQNLL
ncbi:MAG: nucleotidyl transferase AbiEii/AbiGii toxin family protein [Chloroflexi bacterium]|nr:nucleotidyl transferase AbiEii/AbiGii toxin family protein [Chloroflexota bacterium]